VFETQVFPIVRSKMDVSARLVAAWGRVIAKIGKGAFADKLGVDVKTVSRAMAGDTLPELHTAFNALAADPTALDEIADLYGVQIRPKQIDTANDMEIIAELSALVSEWIAALADGRRDHNETMKLAKRIRTLSNRMSAVCAEADRLSGLSD
jgi:hypothetical protein